MATEREVGEMLTAIMPLFANYRPPVGDDALVLFRAWHKVTGHLPADVLRAAVFDAATRTEFFPTPLLVLARATALLTGDKRAGLEAWGDVLAKVKEHGYLRQPEFADPLVAHIVKAMGWENICMSENETADRARFVQAYEQAQGREYASAAELPAVTEARALAAGNRPQGVTSHERVAALTAGIGQPSPGQRRVTARGGG